MLCPYCGAKSKPYKGECPRCPPGAMERSRGPGSYRNKSGYEENVRLRKWAERKEKKCKQKKVERTFYMRRRIDESDVEIIITGIYDKKNTRTAAVKQQDYIVNNVCEEIRNDLTYQQFDEDY